MFLSNGEFVDSTTVASAAETTPLFVGATYNPETSIELAGRFAEYAALYRRQLWVYVVCNKVGRSAARVPIRVTEQRDKGSVAVPESPYAKLLANPNPQLDEYALWEWTATTFEVYGEAIWVKLRDDAGQVVELSPMQPANVSINRTEDGPLEYRILRNPKLPPIPEADIVHFKAYNPDSPIRGMSQLEPLRLTLANEDAARRATFSWWQRGARPSVALVHPGTLSTGAAERLAARWDARHAGADNMGGTAVLEEGMKPEIMQLSAEEMQYIESRKLNREEVCAAADVPPPVVHILDQATYSNITEQMRSMYRDTMTPRFRLYESTLDTQLRPEFDPHGTQRAGFALDEVLRGDYETRVDSAVKLVTAGIATAGEGRDAVGLPAKEGTDQILAPFQLMPLDAPRDGQRPQIVPGAETGQDLAPVPQPPPGRTKTPPPPKPVRRGGRPPKGSA